MLLLKERGGGAEQARAKYLGLPRVWRCIIGWGNHQKSWKDLEAVWAPTLRWTRRGMSTGSQHQNKSEYGVMTAPPTSHSVAQCPWLPKSRVSLGQSTAVHPVVLVTCHFDLGGLQSMISAARQHPPGRVSAINTERNNARGFITACT